MATIHHNTLKKAERAEIELRDLSGDMGRKYSAKWRDYVFLSTDVQECLAAALLAKMLRLEYKVSLNQRFDRKTKLPAGYEVEGLKRYDTLPDLADVVDAMDARNKSKTASVEVKETPAPVAAAKVATKPVKAKDDTSDEQDEGEEDEEKTPHTVVPATYRKAYAERGNPNHCGDWLAQMLEGKFSSKDGAFDRDVFLRTMQKNGVDINGKWTMSQSPGWQGRIRMTGRLKLEIALLKSGTLSMPSGVDVTVPEEYMEVLRSKHKAYIDG